MIAFIIGLSSGLLLIALFVILKKYDKKIVYGLTLTGIGFLYVGYTWSDLLSLIITSIQAIVFVALAYYGIKKSMYILALGFFLHGIWDLVYHPFDKPGLIPPQYDVFCLTIDFVIGIYLLVLARQSSSSVKRTNA
ncbi:MAG: DUF6010 family protein [Chitinophagaceae bacterium]